MLLSCCLIHIAIIILRGILYLVYLCPCLDLALFMSYLCDLIFIFSLIFIVINHITSFKQPYWFSYNFCMITWIRKTIFKYKFSFSVLLRFCLIFYQFPSGVAYKSVAYKKSVYITVSSTYIYTLFYISMEISLL